MAGDYRETVLSRLEGFLNKSDETKFENAEDELVIPILPKGYTIEDVLGVGIADFRSASKRELISLYLTWRANERFQQSHLSLDKEKLKTIARKTYTIREGMQDRNFYDIMDYFQGTVPHHREMGGDKKNLVLVYFREK